MKTMWIAAAMVGLFAGALRAEDPTTEPTAQVRHGVRMRLVPPAPPKPLLLDSDDPLEGITGAMTEIVGRLAELKTDAEVQEQQKQVVSQLDQIIKQIEQQASQNGNGSGSSPTKPMTDSRIAGGPGGIGDLHDPKAGTKNFGNLPPKEREAILQSKTEGFPPGYESLLQSYYQRLAQEKVGEEATGGRISPPATRPVGP